MIDSDFERFWHDLLRRQCEARLEKWRLKLTIRLVDGARPVRMQNGFVLN